MPILARFNGIVIRMYFQQSEHNPPHIHVFYGSYVSAIEIKTGNVLDGFLPAKILVMVKEWINNHEVELLEIWDTQEFKLLK